MGQAASEHVRPSLEGTSSRMNVSSGRPTEARLALRGTLPAVPSLVPLLVAIASLLIALPQRALAAELEVAWQAPDCARRSDFERRLTSALPSDPEALLERPLEVSVVIASSAAGGFTLALTTRHDGAELRRELETASCAEA